MPLKQLLKRYIPLSTRQRMRSVAERAAQLLQLVRRLGFSVTCPLCHWRASSMIPDGVVSKVFQEQRVIGAGWRLNNVCPRCRCNDRERLMYFFLRDVARLSEKPLTVLHVAPERCLEKFITSFPSVRYVSMDLQEPGVMTHMDLTKLAFRDNVFDAVLCNNVLEHVPDDLAAMKELNRVMKPGAWAILQTPISLTLNATDEDLSVTSPQERKDRFGQDDHCRMYARDYFDRLQSSGFEMTLYDYTGVRSSFALPGDLLYVACKLPSSSLLEPANGSWRRRQTISHLASTASDVCSTVRRGGAS